MPDTPPRVGDVLIASHVVTIDGERVPAGWTLVAHAEPGSPTMPDTPRQLGGHHEADTMPDTLSREIAEAVSAFVTDLTGTTFRTDEDEVERFLLPRLPRLAHIDALTAAVRRVESEYDAVSGWHDVAYEGVTDALYAVLAILRGEQ